MTSFSISVANETMFFKTIKVVVIDSVFFEIR